MHGGGMEQRRTKTVDSAIVEYEKVERRFPPKSARGVALVDLKVWHGQINDKRGLYQPWFA